MAVYAWYGLKMNLIMQDGASRMLAALSYTRVHRVSGAGNIFVYACQHSASCVDGALQHPVADSRGVGGGWEAVNRGLHG